MKKKLVFFLIFFVLVATVGFNCTCCAVSEEPSVQTLAGIHHHCCVEKNILSPQCECTGAGCASTNRDGLDVRLRLCTGAGCASTNRDGLDVRLRLCTGAITRTAIPSESPVSFPKIVPVFGTEVMGNIPKSQVIEKRILALSAFDSGPPLYLAIQVFRL